MHTWQPIADLDTIILRANIFRMIREFFYTRKVLEVETPLLACTTIPDPNIHSLQTQLLGNPFFLQTSPEFHMKRLLAAGSGSIFQIGKAFRDDELGQWHNPEFTMLEWYRLDFDAKALMQEVDDFLQILLKTKPAIALSYQNAFLKFLSIDPLEATSKELMLLASEHSISMHGFDPNDKDVWLNLLMSYCIEPNLNTKGQSYFIYDFPASQAALAQLSKRDPRVAERFEVYLHGIELANGFHELRDAKEQRQRFEIYLAKRKQLNLPTVPMPENFLSALEHGLPDCSGVALGLDRLLMLCAEKNNIKDVLSFTVENA